MASYCPIQYPDDQPGYEVMLEYQKKGSYFVDVEWIPRPMLEIEIQTGAVTGYSVAPYISNGLH